MPHWSDVYPHELHASVILKNNKIKLWKVGDGKLSERFMVDELVKQRPEYSYQEKTWTVSNSKEHNDVFETHSKEWLRQWPHHEDYKWFPAYSDPAESAQGDSPEAEEELPY